MMRIFKHFSLVLLFGFLFVNITNGQSNGTIKGKVTGQKGQPVEFATVAFLALPDSNLVSGTITGETGDFALAVSNVSEGLIQVSCVGFTSASKQVSLGDEKPVDISLQPRSYALGEVKAVRERIKAKSKGGATTYFVNSNMKKASASGIDIVKFVPGIQVDMMQNVMVEGSENVIIMVDGIERSPDFLGQLDSDLIDKVEINHQPGAQYRSNITAVVNVHTKRKTSRGVSGHIYGEVPLSSGEVYSFPSAAILYSTEEFNVFGSYRGEFSYFDIEAKNTKRVFGEPEMVLGSHGALHQENWSHKVMGGIDWFPDSTNQVNVYAFFNPYSNEQDGQVITSQQTENLADFENVFEKDDRDENLAFGGSVFYRHLFDSHNRELAVEANYYQYDGKRGTSYTGMDENFSGYSKPFEKAFVGRLNYHSDLGSRWGLAAGLENRYRKLGESGASSSDYRENILSGFSTFSFNSDHFNGQAGFRAEYLETEAVGNDHDELSLFPFMSVSYKPADSHQVKVSYRRSVIRPHIFQLNPAVLQTDVFTQQQGNPALRAGFNQELALEYSLLAGNQFFACGPFYSKSTDVIANLTTMPNTGEFFVKPYNLGDITRLGVRFKAALTPFKRLSFNPYFRVFHLETDPGELAKSNHISPEKKWTSEWGFGLSWQIKNGVSFSASGMQRADVHHIQSSSFEDFLYFLSLEKTFFKNLSVGITSAVPFAEEVTYQGHSLVGNGFTENSQDNILTSKFPFWFKIKYSFSAGLKRDRIHNSDEFESKRVRKGF
ncbi:TonB-dependent receptor [Marinilabilia sp.]